MLHPQPCSEHEHPHVQKPQLTWKKPIENSLAALAKKKRSCESGPGSHSFEELQVYGNPRGVCRICRRQFSSGRALGGHMRVHGPLFTPAAGRKRKLEILTDSDDDGEEEAVVEVPTSLDGEAYAPHMNSSSDLYDGDDADADDNDGLAADYHVAAHDKKLGFIDRLDFSSNPEPDDYASAEKNPLYMLRHKPKKSWKFTDEDFSMDLLSSGPGMALNLSSKSSIFPSTEMTRLCSVCGKAFWSWKALSGHMRCHPEREWRGVLPPDVKAGSKFNHKRNSGMSNYGESTNFEHESDAKDKTETEPHRRAAIKNTVLHMEDEEAVEEQLQSNDDEKDCVSSSSAMEYESNPVWPTGSRASRKSEEIKARSMQSSSQRDHDERLATSETTSLADLGEAKQAVEIPDLLFILAEAAWTIEQETEVRKNHLQKGPTMFRFLSTKRNATGKQEGQALLFNSKDVSGTTKGTMKFACSTCKKTFDSPQALGGHRASHKKTKGCFARTSLGEDTAGEEFGIASEEFVHGTLPRGDVLDQDFVKRPKQRHQVQLPNNTKGYECSVCHRVFLTGQALGGHKSRCHYTGEKVAKAAASVTSNNKQASERGNSSKVDEGSILDLNLPASSTNEDSEVGCAAVELHLFPGDDEAEVVEKGVTCTTSESHDPAELSLGAPWAAKHLSKSASWALEGRWPAVEPAMVF